MQMEVNWEDQQKINEFSKLNTRLTGFDIDIKGLRQKKEDLDDLSMEIELIDEDEELMYSIGETFVHLKQSEIMALLEKDQSKIDELIETKTDERSSLMSRMDELKAALYARFGRENINLERE